MASAADAGTAGKQAAANLVRSVLGWLALFTGVAASAYWVQASQLLGAQIDFSDVGPGMSLFYLLVFGPILALAILLGLMFGQSVLRIGERPLLWLGLGLGAGAVGIGGTLGFSWLSGGVALAPLGDGNSLRLVAIGIGLTLFQVTSEEVLFRGWLQPGLIARIGPFAAVVITALVFAAFHAIAATADWISLVNMLLGGLLFGLLALRSGGIIAPVAAHFAYNAIEDNVLGLVPNPGNGALGSLHNLELVGAPIWGGGQDGLNASIGTSVILVALCLPLLLRGNRTPVATPVQPRFG